MYGVVTEESIKSIMNLRKPNKAAGYYSDDFSQNVHQFLAMLECRSDYSGSMAILPKAEAEKVFNTLFNLLKGWLVQDHGYSVEPESLISIWHLDHNESLVMALDVFGEKSLSPVLYNDAKTVNKISFKNFNFESIKNSRLDENFKNALKQISSY